LNAVPSESWTGPPQAAGHAGPSPFGLLARRWILLAIAAAIIAYVIVQLDMPLFGYSQLVLPRTWFTVFFFLHLISCLQSFGRRDEVLRLLVTPFITQPYQVCLGWDVEAGALSIARILPYLVLAAALLAALWRRAYRPTRVELGLTATVLGVSVISWVIGSPYTMVGLPVTFLLGILLPVFAMYVSSIAQRRPDLLEQFPAAIAVGIFALMAGFLAALGLGTTIETFRGEGSVESAREVGDFNSLIPYLILSWPFALAYLRGRSALLTTLLFTVFIVVTFAGVSKTMMVLAPPLVLLSLPAALARVRTGAVVLGFIVGVIILIGLIQLAVKSPIGAFVLDLWVGRLDIDRNALDALSISDLLSPVSVGSEAWDDRAVLRVEALRIFGEHPLLGSGWATFPFLSRIEQGTSHAITTDLLQQTGLLGTTVFWAVTLEVIARLLGQVRAHASTRRALVLFPAAFLLWLVAAHTVGAQLFMAANTGFTVNAVTGMLYVLYLKREVIHSIGSSSARA
jgi:hypothetical protein